MANKKLVYILLVIIPFIVIGCNSVEIKNRKIDSNIEFQYEKDNFLTRNNEHVGRRKNFELIFMHKFNDSVFISSDGIELFTERIITDDTTDNPNVSFLLNVEKHQGHLIKIKIPNKKIDEKFYLSERFKLVYFFYYEGKLIVRYSNKLYNIY